MKVYLVVSSDSAVVAAYTSESEATKHLNCIEDSNEYRSYWVTDLDVLESASPILRETALKKLTKAERVLLGLGVDA